MAGEDVVPPAKTEREMEVNDVEDDDGWATDDASESGSEVDDTEGDPTFGAIELTRSKLSRMSLRTSAPGTFEEVAMPQLNDKEKKCLEGVEKMIKDGGLPKLKVEECKIYLRKHGLRLTGNKNVLQARIQEHLEVLDGGGEMKYPVSSFVLNCQGDACMGDVVMFEQNVYDMFNVASRSATAPPCGTRTIAGRIVKESYGAAKQQHTFTVEVLWSKGEKPFPPLHPLLIKGRNLYRLKTMRQIWDNEDERNRVLQEKHRRGGIARHSREARLHEKELKMARGKRHKAPVSAKPTTATEVQQTGRQPLASQNLTGNPHHQTVVYKTVSGYHNTWQQPLVSEKSKTAGTRKAGHHGPASFKPSTAAGHRNAAKQPDILPKDSLLSLPTQGMATQQRQSVTVFNSTDENIRDHSAYMHNILTCVGRTGSHQHSEQEIQDSKRQGNPEASCYPSNFGPPHYMIQLHGNHGDGYEDRRGPLRNLNYSRLVLPPSNSRFYPNHQGDSLFQDQTCRNLTFSSRGRNQNQQGSDFSTTVARRNSESPEKYFPFSGMGTQRHSHRPAQGQPCRWHMQGRCRYGDHCRYLH